MSASRLLWGVADDGALPASLAKVLPERRSPWIATIIVALLAVLVILIFEKIEAVAEITNFALFVTFLLVNGAVLVLRVREPDTERPFRIPGAIAGIPLIPVLGIVSVLALMTQTGLKTALIGAGMLIAGVIVQWAMANKAA